MRTFEQQPTNETLLDTSIIERIYNPTVQLFYDRFKLEHLDAEEIAFAQSLSAEAKAAFLLTLKTHVHKEKPVFIYLIAKKFGLDTNRAKSLAVMMDTLWMLSLMFDDLQDADTQRHGMPTVWSVFGKDKTYEIGTEMLEAILHYTTEKCGESVSNKAKESVFRGVGANLNQNNITLENTSFQSLCDSYDDRNDFSGVLGIEAAQLMLVGEEFPNDDFQAIRQGVREMNRGAQIVNDMKDLDDTYQRGFSDIRNGVVTIPLLMMFLELSEAKQADFKSFFGSKRTLSSAEQTFIANEVKNTNVLQRSVYIVDKHYSSAFQLMRTGFKPENIFLLVKWIAYKREALQKYE